MGGADFRRNLPIRIGLGRRRTVDSVMLRHHPHPFNPEGPFGWNPVASGARAAGVARHGSHGKPGTGATGEAGTGATGEPWQAATMVSIWAGTTGARG